METPKHRLIDIKKKLGFQRDEAYTVFKFPLKPPPVDVSGTCSRVYPRSMSAILPNRPSDVKPAPSPKPRRIPPKPPLPKPPSPHRVTGSSTSSVPPSTPPPINKPAIKPKPKSFPSKLQTLDQTPSPECHFSPGHNPSSSSEENVLSPINTLPCPPSPGRNPLSSNEENALSTINTRPHPLEPHSLPRRNPSGSTEEILLSTINTRPRLNTPKLEQHDSSSNDVLPMTPESMRKKSLIVDDTGMATVTGNGSYRPSAYCTVDLDNDDDTKICRPRLINDTTCAPSFYEYSRIDVDKMNLHQTSSQFSSTNTEYDVTTHHKSNSEMHPPLQARYSSFDRSEKPNPVRSRVLPYYDEIDIDPTQRRPVLIAQTTGYSTLGCSTDNNRAQSSTSKATPPLKPPLKPLRPDLPPKPSLLRKSNESSRESSPFSPIVSPVHKSQKDTNNLSSLNQQSDFGTDPETSKRDDLCVIDIDAMIALAKSKNIKIPNSDDKEQLEHTSDCDPLPGTQEFSFDNSLVKISDVLNESLLRRERNETMSHMYETLPWDTEEDETTVQQTTGIGRRKAPPPPVGESRGSPVMFRKDEVDDLNKSLTLGRKPRHLVVTASKSNDDKESNRGVANANHSPSKVKKSSTSESPATKSKFKFKSFMRSSSKDEALRSSMKKNSRKSSHQPPSFASAKSKSSTLPTRPRGKSLDPFMSSEIYSTIPGDEYNRDKRSPSPLPEAFAYSVVHARDVQLRPPSGIKHQGFRKSQSVEHLYETTKSFNLSSSLDRNHSPIACDDFNVNTAIYSTINKEKVSSVDRKGEEENVMEDDEQPSSPIRDVAHINAGGDCLYAVVTKQPKNNVKKQEESSEIRDFSPPPPLPPPLPSRLVPRQQSAPAPPKPAPYKQLGSDQMVTATKASDKYAHFLNSLPPNRPLPIPNECPPLPQQTEATSNGSLPKKLSFDPPVKSFTPHTYDMVDFDDGQATINSSHVASSPKVLHNKIRPLKPKEKSAPPPPQESQGTTLNSNSGTTPNSDSHIHSFLFKSDRLTSFIEAGEGQSRLSTSTSDGTISTVETVETPYYDSDSSEFDPSSDEDDEDEPKRPLKVQNSKIYYIAEEILTTERTFVRGLTLLHKDFRAHMLSANNAHDKVVVTEDTLNLILSSNLGGIYQLNLELLKELEDRIKNWDSKPKLGDIFVRRAPFLKLYSPYISNFDKALKTLEEQSKRNPLFAQVVKEFEIEPKCNNLTVAAYLLETVQRIPRYKILLAEYIKHLPQESDDREDSEKAFGIIASVASHVNETIKQIENFRKIIEVSKKLIGDVGDSLISPHRKLLKEGELIKSSRKEKQLRMFFLFTDLLVYAAAIPPANTTFRVIKRIPLDGMRVHLLDDPEMKYSFQIISTCKSFRLEATSPDERDQWMKAFEGSIKDHFSRKQSRQLHRRSMMVDFTDGFNDGEGTLGLFAPPWLPDSSVSMCQLCGIHFTVTRRRHHCRACGMIFCSDCSSYVVPLPYKSNKPCRVCQTCCTTLMDGDDSSSDQISKPNSLKNRPRRLSQQKKISKISLPSVLREVRARDDSAQISGYLFHRKDKNRQWKRKWFVVFNLVMYEFKRHEDVTAQQSIPLPSYTVSTEIQGQSDPMMFSLEHTGAGRLLFKADDDEQLESWVTILQKAVKGELNIPLS